MIRSLICILAALLPTAPHAGPAPADERRPSVLVHCPRPSVDQWYWWVDLRYLRELHAKGFEVDYTDAHEDLTWERVRRYDSLVIYTVPVSEGSYYNNTPDRPPYREEFVEIVERFLAGGGGVFLMAMSINGDESFLPLIRPWGARIPYERIEELDPRNVRSVPRMSGIEKLWFTDNVAASPVSDGVEQVWLPFTEQYASSETAPIEVSDDWRVVLRGPASSRTVAIDPTAEVLLPPGDAIVREEPLREPALFAIRDYRAGRLAFCAIWPQFSIGQGTEWLYDRIVLSRGLDGRPSHFGRLIENTLRWLAEPRLASGSAGAWATDPRRLIEPNERSGVREAFVRRSASRALDPAAALARAGVAGRLHRGLIGAETALGSGEGTVADHARAARAAGLDFVVFLDEARALDETKLKRLKADCLEHSASDLQLYPGYRIETNTGNRIFLFGREVALPPPELVLGGRLNQQYQNPESGEFEPRGPFLNWLAYGLLATGEVNVGYYGFVDRPSAQRIADLRLYSMVGLRTYWRGRLLEDNLDAYLASAAGTLPPVPAAVHLVASPAGLEEAARERTGLTYARSASVGALWDSLGYAGIDAAPNVFTSDGPMIELWPDAFRYYTFAAEDFVAEAALMPAPIAVRSEAGLKEIRIYDGDRLYRRFLCDGAKRFERVLLLSASLQTTLVLVAEDVEGGRAVSGARRGWKGGDLVPLFCGDRVNHCDRPSLMAKGPGRIPVSRAPAIDAGHTWDGGPIGVRPVMHLQEMQRPTLVSDRGTEGARGFNNRPFLELADEGAVRVGALFEILYDERVPVMGPWQTYGPLAGPSRLFKSEMAFTAFDRPALGPHRNMYPGQPTKRGAEVSIFENDVTFKEDQTPESLLLARQEWYAGPYPVTLVHGRGGKRLETFDLSPGSRPGEGPLIETGDWIGCFGPADTNLSVHINRGQPLRLRFRGEGSLSTAFLGDVEGKAVRAGDRLHYELLSAVDPLDHPRRGLRRILRIVRYLQKPDGLRLLRGRAIDRSGVKHGLLELEAEDAAVALRLRRPKRRVELPLPLRVAGLNPRWSAGLLLKQGYSQTHHGTDRQRYRPVGFDRRGRVWATLFPDYAELTEAVVGHPVVCDRGELFIQVTPKDGRGERDSWHVSVNNPTDLEIRAVFRRAMPLAGLEIDERAVVVPAGGYVVLQ